MRIINVDKLYARQQTMSRVSGFMTRVLFFDAALCAERSKFRVIDNHIKVLFVSLFRSN